MQISCDRNLYMEEIVGVYELNISRKCTGCGEDSIIKPEAKKISIILSEDYSAIFEIDGVKEEYLWEFEAEADGIIDVKILSNSIEKKIIAKLHHKGTYLESFGYSDEIVLGSNVIYEKVGEKRPIVKKEQKDSVIILEWPEEKR